MSLVKTHGSNRINTEGCNVWQQSKAIDIGVCCFRNSKQATKADLNKTTSSVSSIPHNMQSDVLDLKYTMPRLHKGTN